MGVNKYAQHDESHGGGHEVDVRRIDNSTVLQKQVERLQVSRQTEWVGGFKEMTYVLKSVWLGTGGLLSTATHTTGHLRFAQSFAAHTRQPRPGRGGCGAGAPGGSGAQRQQGAQPAGDCGGGSTAQVRRGWCGVVVRVCVWWWW